MYQNQTEAFNERGILGHKSVSSEEVETSYLQALLTRLEKAVIHQWNNKNDLAYIKYSLLSEPDTIAPDKEDDRPPQDICSRLNKCIAELELTNNQITNINTNLRKIV